MYLSSSLEYRCRRLLHSSQKEVNTIETPTLTTTPASVFAAWVCAAKAAEAAWQARVDIVTARWAKDLADKTCFARIGGGRRDREQDPPDA